MLQYDIFPEKNILSIISNEDETQSELKLLEKIYIDKLSKHININREEINYNDKKSK